MMQMMELVGGSKPVCLCEKVAGTMEICPPPRPPPLFPAVGLGHSASIAGCSMVV